MWDHVPTRTRHGAIVLAPARHTEYQRGSCCGDREQDEEKEQAILEQIIQIGEVEEHGSDAVAGVLEFVGDTVPHLDDLTATPTFTHGDERIPEKPPKLDPIFVLE